MMPADEDRLRASELDAAYGKDPHDSAIARERQALLDKLAVTEHGITFRYIPRGSFLMGSESGDADERPVHRVELDDFWIAETPISWAKWCSLMDWEPPPKGCPKKDELAQMGRHFLVEESKLRLQYCEDLTRRATDWHTHASVRPDIFGKVDRGNSSAPWSYENKPMVAVSWPDAVALCQRISSAPVTYRLPTEAEWERAARGGLVGSRYSWGNEPTEGRCDCNRFDQFSILPMRHFPTNGYGLYAMNGGVWEWTADCYDAEYYAASPSTNPAGPEMPGPVEVSQRVLRGGSWADSPDVATVSFRTSRAATSSTRGGSGGPLTPTIGFRVCREIRI